MLEGIAEVVLEYIVREIERHEPEIQELVMSQLHTVGTMVLEYVSSRIAANSDSKEG